MTLLRTETSRQTDGRTANRQTDEQTDRQTDRQPDRQIIQFLNPNPYFTIRQHHIDILTGTKHEINVIDR